jgi:hypothetical protein
MSTTKSWNICPMTTSRIYSSFCSSISCWKYLLSKTKAISSWSPSKIIYRKLKGLINSPKESRLALVPAKTISKFYIILSSTTKSSVWITCPVRWGPMPLKCCTICTIKFTRKMKMSKARQPRSFCLLKFSSRCHDYLKLSSILLNTMITRKKRNHGTTFSKVLRISTINRCTTA